MNPVRALVCDMDGLLLDSEGMSLAAWRLALAEYGFELADADYLPMIGLTMNDVRQLMLRMFPPSLPLEELYAKKVAYVDEIIRREGIALRPGADAFLESVRRCGLPAAVATSTSLDRAVWKLRLAGIADAFRAVAGGDETANGKPAPDLFLLAAERLGVAPENCLALEDSDPGALAAHAAGMRVIIVPDRKPPSSEAAAVAYRVLPSLAEAAGLLPGG